VTTAARSLIHGREFLEALAEAGVIRNEDHVRRVIIDAAVDTAVVIYVERYGDDRLLSVALASLAEKGGLVIRTIPYEDPPGVA
jgi:hypothetical protein